MAMESKGEKCQGKLLDFCLVYLNEWRYLSQKWGYLKEDQVSGEFHAF